MGSRRGNKALWVLVALCVAATFFIFSNSLKDGEQSNSDSMFFVRFVEPIFDAVFGEGVVDANFVVRKCAHVLEFMCLGVLSAVSAILFEKRTGKRLRIYFVLGCLGVATVDELIQNFTGRTCSFSDVVLDFFGALLGFGFVYGCSYLKKRFGKRESV